MLATRQVTALLVFQTAAPARMKSVSLVTFTADRLAGLQPKLLGSEIRKWDGENGLCGFHRRTLFERFDERRLVKPAMSGALAFYVTL